MKRIGTSDRLVLFAAAMVVLVSSAAAQNFTVHMKNDDGSEGTTYYVSPTAVRTVMPGISDSIDRLDRGTIIRLDHKAKTYSELTVAQVRDEIASTFGKQDPETQAM